MSALRHNLVKNDTKAFVPTVLKMIGLIRYCLTIGLRVWFKIIPSGSMVGSLHIYRYVWFCGKYLIFFLFIIFTYVCKFQFIVFCQS